MRRKDTSVNVLGDLLGKRPGWRLEPTSTPGAAPLWCFVFDGEIEFSVTAGRDSILLYEMKTDREIAFSQPEELATWFKTHRAEALRERPTRVSRRSRFRSLLEWS